MVSVRNITQLLHRMDDGEAGAVDELMTIVYADLERMAASHLRRQYGRAADQITLEPAAMVNETFLQLLKQRKGFDNRGHFFAIATRLMLRVLSEYRRTKLAAKRGGAAGTPTRLTLAVDRRLAADQSEPEALVEIEELTGALERLEALDPRRAEIVKMRVVWSMTVPEVAEALDVSPSSVDRDWKWAKAWLADELGLLGD